MQGFYSMGRNLSLKDGSVLQKCTWQEVLQAMRGDPDLSWLTDEIGQKYGF